MVTKYELRPCFWSSTYETHKHHPAITTSGQGEGGVLCSPPSLLAMYMVTMCIGCLWLCWFMPLILVSCLTIVAFQRDPGAGNTFYWNSMSKCLSFNKHHILGPSASLIRELVLFETYEQITPLVFKYFYNILLFKAN